LKEEIEALMVKLVEKVLIMSKDREGYDLRNFAIDYLKDNL